MAAFKHCQRPPRRPVLWGIGLGFPVVLILTGGWYWRYGRPLVDAARSYVFALPPVVMDLTRQTATTVPKAGELAAPVNQFAVMTKYPDASFRAAHHIGLDTLFATAWADLAEDPLRLPVPETAGRHYGIALFDMWFNVFASIDTRTAGSGAENHLIAGPGWTGAVPDDTGQVHRAPTRWVWDNGQMQADSARSGDLLDAANAYVLHFDKGETPPNNATWFLSLFEPDGFYVPNALDRYALAPWMKPTLNTDGSLDIWILCDDPGGDKTANWLPTPQSGPFNLTVRIFWPTGAAMDGSHAVLPVVKVPQGQSPKHTKH